MEPVEINAGTVYLRQLRADRALDDRPALAAAFADPARPRLPDTLTGPDGAEDDRVNGDGTDDQGAEDEGAEDTDHFRAAETHVVRRTRQWADDQRCSWAVAEPTTGELLGEVGLRLDSEERGTAELEVWTAPQARGQGVATAAVPAVLRFGFGGLGLRRIDYRHAAHDTASEALARRCGFTPLDSDSSGSGSGGGSGGDSSGGGSGSGGSPRVWRRTADD